MVRSRELRPLTKIGVYALGVAVAFAGAFGVGSLTGDPVEEPPEHAGDGTTDPHAGDDHGSTEPGSDQPGSDQPGSDQSESDQSESDQSESGGPGAGGTAPGGLQISAEGYLLSPVEAPASADEPGELSFQVIDAEGEPVTAFTESHEQRLHLIVVRGDTTHYRHVHPRLGPDGTWRVDWQWDAAGSYKIFADFTPAALGSGLTLSRTVQVAGDYRPAPLPHPATVDQVGGFTATLDGDLAAGTGTTVTATVTRDGRPVTDLQPYLGAAGHLVALREGDLAYLHVHPEDRPAGQPAAIPFHLEAPTAGTYRLFLEFQVDGEVHLAEFTVTADGPGYPEDHSHD